MNTGDAGRVIAGAGTREMPARYPCLGGGAQPVHCLRNTINDGWSPGQGVLLPGASTNTAMTLGSLE